MTTRLTAVALGLSLFACGGEQSGGDQTGQQSAATPGTPSATPSAAPAASANPLLNPMAMTETAPATYRAKFETSKGDFTVEVTRAWAPLGADRFYNLVKNGFYDDARFFRVIQGFMAQFGINGDPQVSARWRAVRIQDDPVKQSNTRGMVTFAMGGANTRTTQLFISFGDNSRLDAQGFAPFGRVAQGMDVVDKINSEYGDTPSQNQGQIQQQGNAYLNAQFPRLDYIRKATVLP